MDLIVKQDGRVISEFSFSKGPIYIGRGNDNDVCLPDIAVSRRHTIIHFEEDKWRVQDLGSTNKTFLNEKEVHKADLSNGDILGIGVFTLQAKIKKESEKDSEGPIQIDETMEMEAVLSTPHDEVIVRKPDGVHAPAMRLTAKRLTDFSQATEKICGAASLDELLQTLLDIMMRQFTAFHVWCGLRTKPDGPLTHQDGRRRDKTQVKLEDLILNDRVTTALERGQSLVLPSVAARLEQKERIKSAMITTLKRSKKCYGVLYIDNTMVHEHYKLSDLDYLMFLGIHTAAVMGKFL